MLRNWKSKTSAKYNNLMALAGSGGAPGKEGRIDMTKQGLGRQTQGDIVRIVKRYAAQGVVCSTAHIHASLYPGQVYTPQQSSLRVTLSWMVRTGMLRRQRHGRYASFYLGTSRTREDDHGDTLQS